MIFRAEPPLEKRWKNHNGKHLTACFAHAMRWSHGCVLTCMASWDSTVFFLAGGLMHAVKQSDSKHKLWNYRGIWVVKRPLFYYVYMESNHMLKSCVYLAGMSNLSFFLFGWAVLWYKWLLKEISRSLEKGGFRGSEILSIFGLALDVSLSPWTVIMAHVATYYRGTFGLELGWGFFELWFLEIPYLAKWDWNMGGTKVSNFNSRSMIFLLFNFLLNQNFFLIEFLTDQDINI